MLPFVRERCQCNQCLQLGRDSKIGDIGSSPSIHKGEALKSSHHAIKLRSRGGVRIEANRKGFFEILVHLWDGYCAVSIFKIIPNCLSCVKIYDVLINRRGNAKDNVASSHVIRSIPSSLCCYSSGNFCGRKSRIWVIGSCNSAMCIAPKS